MSVWEILLDGAALHIEAAPLDTVAEAVDRSSAHNADARLLRAFEQRGDDLHRFIVLRVRDDRHAAEDLLQQTCYEAARKRRIPVGDDAAQAWLFGIAKNLIRKHFRRLRREGRQRRVDAAAGPNTQILEAVGDEPATLDQSDLAPHLLTAIAALRHADQQLILSSYFENRSHEELARTSGVSVRAIEGRLYRARAALREALSATLGEDGS